MRGGAYFMAIDDISHIPLLAYQNDYNAYVCNVLKQDIYIYTRFYSFYFSGEIQLIFKYVYSPYFLCGWQFSFIIFFSFLASKNSFKKKRKVA